MSLSRGNDRWIIKVHHFRNVHAPILERFPFEHDMALGDAPRRIFFRGASLLRESNSYDWDSRSFSCLSISRSRSCSS
jgi:hypothetical protein